MKSEARMGLAFVSPDGRRELSVSARVARTWGARLEGLLLTPADRAGALLLVDCPSVHTVGMKYPIDVLLIGDGQVLRSERGVQPGRVVRSRGATWALERPSMPAPWPSKGDLVHIGELGGEAWGVVLDLSVDQVAEVA